MSYLFSYVYILQELESLFSGHFGRTPQSTPFASQIIESDENSENDDQESQTSTWLDQQARQFLDDQDEYHSDSDESDGIEFGNNVMSDDDPDVSKISQFKANGCGCKHDCHNKYKTDVIFRHILDVREMEKSEKDMYIMATVVDDKDKHKTERGKKRKRHRHVFEFLGQKICKKMFMLAFDIGKHALQGLLTHVTENGAVPRVHGNVGKKPSHALTFEQTKKVITFISNYADEFGLPQPAAPRGRDNTPPIYLSSETTKQDIHGKYVSSVSELEPPMRSVKLTTFRNIWRACLSHIKIATPRDDVCATCEKIRKRIMDAVTEDEKLEAAQSYEEHIISAQNEREVYNGCLQRARDSHLNNAVDARDKYVHYTFDFSQNVSLPHHSRQMGPMYFASLRKIQIFGFRIDGIPEQLNFLVDENETIEKNGTLTHGPNWVISMIDWALQTHGVGELSCAIHADNCPGNQTFFRNLTS